MCPFMLDMIKELKQAIPCLRRVVNAGQSSQILH